MPRVLRSIAALVLALIWLPATLHCGLKAAGWLESVETACCADHDEAPGEQPAGCSHNTCGLVESGEYQPATHFLKVATSATVVCFSSLMEFVPETLRVPESDAPAEAESPPEIPRTWQFVARAALSPRAPPCDC